MTNLKGAELVQAELLPPFGEDVVQEALQRYLDNPMFRAARYEELIIDDNPYRRPVRPNDLGMVDFSERLQRKDFSRLSSLMGHRILLNIYDARKLFLPQTPTAEKWHDYTRFYDRSSLYLGELIRPYLERHVFSFVRDEAAERVTHRRAGVTVRLAEFAVEARKRLEALHGLFGSSKDRASMVSTAAIQSLAVTLCAHGQAPFRPTDVAGLAALTGPTTTTTTTTASTTRTPEERTVGAELAQAGITTVAPHSYFQFYLPSTLAMMNYLNAAAHEPGQLFARTGALMVHALEERALTEVGLPSASTSGGAGDLSRATYDGGDLDVIVERVEEFAGEFGLRELSRGIEEFAVLADVHHEDRMRQFAWIADMPGHVEKAERLQTAIESHNIEVDLDTFVESWEECSTTHVHDDDRLLIIESGEMEFWNCHGVTHKYRAGDKAFIPKHRLHGSVVLSGECVYHQPVITDELNRRYGESAAR